MERIVMSLAGEFTRRSCPSTVILPSGENAQKTQRWFETEEGFRPEISSALTHAFGRRRAGNIPALAALIRRSPATVVNIHYALNFPSLNDIVAIRLAGKRCVVSLHMADGANPAARLRKTRLASSFCSTVIAVSQFQKEGLVRAGVPEGKIRVIPCGISQPPFSPCARVEARRRLGIPSDAFVISTAARLVPAKGIADLMQAMGYLVTERANTWVLVAGDGPERDRLEAMASAQRLTAQYRFLGELTSRADLHDLYAAADVFVLPSHGETFGLVYAEAAARAVPSIGYAVGGVPETINHGKSGLLTRRGDIAALADAIKTLRDDSELRHRLSEGALAHAQERFSVAKMADQYLNVLHPRGLPARAVSPPTRA